jgi:hypothetical protein
MTTEQIRETIISDLPANSPYFQANQMRTIYGCEPLPLSKRLAIGLNDRKFPWNVAVAYVEARKTLPFHIEGDVRDAYDCVFHNYDPDSHVAQACALLEPPFRTQRHILEALLICRNIDLAGIAGWTGLPKEVVDYFQRFFFNVRDRFDDHSFIASIVFPATRYSTFSSDYHETTSDRQKLLQAGHRYGAAEIVFLAGLSRNRLNKTTLKSRTAKLQEALLENALDLVRSGYANHGNAPGLKNAMTLLVAEQNNQGSGLPDETVKGLGAISISQGIMETLQGLQAEDIKKRLYLPDNPSPKQ